MLRKKIKIASKCGATPNTARQQTGQSAVELLISTLVLSFISVAVLGLLALTMSKSRAVENSTDSVQAVRQVMAYIGKDIRNARALGDVAGQTITDPNSGQTIVTGSSTFPSTNDPVYTNGAVSSLNWADGSAPTSFTLSNDTLIVQVPVYDNTLGSGSLAGCFPTGIASGNGLQANVETHVYRIVRSSSDAPGEYRLQWASYPGSAVPGYTPAIKGPITLATGIIGPYNSGASKSGTPSVFQYINRFNSAQPVSAIPNSGAYSFQYLADYTTVLVNLEIYSHAASANVNSKYVDTSTQALKEEFCIRNNAFTDTIGAPSASS